MVGSQRRR